MLSGAHQTPCSLRCPQLHKGPHLSLWQFLASGTSSSFHYFSVVGLKEKVEISCPYSNHDNIHPSLPCLCISQLTPQQFHSVAQKIRFSLFTLRLSLSPFLQMSPPLSWVSPSHILLPIQWEVVTYFPRCSKETAGAEGLQLLLACKMVSTAARNIVKIHKQLLSILMSLTKDSDSSPNPFYCSTGKF